MKQVIIPQSDLDKIEECRKAIREILDGRIDGYTDYKWMFEVTSILWKIANRNYPEYKEK
jgi:hypothetical protein